jgi:hypothetical protein
VNLTAVDNAPVVTGTVGTSYTESGAALTLLSSANVNDVDAANFNGGSVIVHMTSYQSGDVLAVNNQGTSAGQIGVSGTNITYAGTIIGTVSGGTGSDLVVTLNANATPAAVQALMGQLQYSNTSQNPTNYGAAPSRALTITLNDGGNTGSGGPQSTSVNGTINITAVDNAPVFTGTVGSAYTEAGTALPLVSGASINDIDALNFNTGSVTAHLATYQTGDMLIVNNQGTGTGQISVSGSSITYGGTTIGTISGGSAADLVVTLNANATPAAVQALMGQLRYSSTSQDPTLGGSAVTRSLTVTLNDGGNTGTGGPQTASISGIINITAVNNAPTITVTASNPTFMEASGSGTQAAPVSVFSSTNISTIENGQSIVGMTFTVNGLLDGTNESIVVDGKTITLGTASTGTTTSNGLSYTVTIVNDTATVALTSSGISSSVANSVINSISYQDTNLDNPSAGNRVFTITQLKDSGGAANGGVDSTSLTLSSSVRVVPVNDAPTVSVTALNPTFIEASGYGTQAAPVNVFSGANVSTIESGQSVLGLTFTVSGLVDGTNESIVVDGKTINLGSTSMGATSNNGLVYSVTVTGGNATIQLTSSGISSALTNSIINGITYQNTNLDNPTAGNRVFTITQIRDNGGTANGGSDTTLLTLASAVTVVPLNDAPTVNVTASNVTFIEGAGSFVGTPVKPFSGAAVSTIEAGQEIKSLSFTVSNVVDGADEQLNIDGSVIALANGITGTTATNGMTYTVTVVNGTATVVLSDAAGVSVTNINSLINDLSYQNTSAMPTSGARTVTLTQVVDTGGTNNGGTDTTNLAIASSVNVVPVNHAPTLSATANNGTYVEGQGTATGTAVSPFSNVSVSTTDSGQAIESLTFTVANVSDGAAEQINIDGAVISLTNATTGTTAVNGMVYSVSLSGDTATVVLTKEIGVSTANINTLINGLSYQNTSQDPTAGARVITLTTLVDTGGTAGGGVNTANLAVSAQINVVPVNDAPIITAVPVNGTQTAGTGSSTPIFTNASVSTVEAGQNIQSLIFTVRNVTDNNEQITVDSTTILLASSETGTTTLNNIHYTVTMNQNIATVQLSNLSGITATATGNLINNMTYSNLSSNPTAGSRTVSLTQIQDNGGTANGGQDTNNVSLSSNVNVAPAAPVAPAQVTQPTQNPNANLTQTTGSSVDIQVFYSSSSYSVAHAYENTYSDSSYTQISSPTANGAVVVNYDTNSVVTLLAANAHIPSWGWENSPGFIELTPIVRGLSETDITLTAAVQGKVDELVQFGYEAIVSPNATGNSVANFNTDSMSYEFLNQSLQPTDSVTTEDEKEKVTAKNNAKGDYAEKQATKIARNQEFKQRVKDLLRDFGFISDE